jgi:hypothetical protein
MTRPQDNARRMAGRVKRLVRRDVGEPVKRPASGGGTSGRTHRIVLVEITAAEANAFLKTAKLRPTGSMPTVLAAPDLKEKDQRVDSGEVTVVARSLADLRQATPWLARAGRSKRITVAVVETSRPQVLQAPGRVGATDVVSAERRQVAGTGLALVVKLAEAVPVRDVLRAALRADGPGRVPAAGQRLGVTAYADLAFAAGNPEAVFVGPKTTVAREVEHELLDFLVGPVVHAQPDPRIVHLTVAEHLWLPPVDTRVVSPAGFRREASGLGTVRLDDRLSVLGAEGQVLGGGDLRAGLTENQISSLRALAGVQVESAAPPASLGRVLTQLACAGIPVRPLTLAPELAGALGEDLAGRFALDWDAADSLDRESWSVTTRRLALARFAPDAYWGELAARHGRPAVSAPSISVVVPTRRTDFVPFVLAQIERQDWPEVEVVLALHGFAADDPAVKDATAGFGRPLQVLEVPAATVFGNVLNLAATRCSGRLITKMDDDDWYGPHHLTDLVQARAHSGATVVGLTGYHVYLQTSNVTIRWSTPATEAPAGWLAGGTMLLGRDDLQDLGGWRAVPVAEDWHLLAAVRAAGGWLYGIHDMGFLYYRGHDHSWTPSSDGSAGHADQLWLDRDPAPRAGFHPPPQVIPLRHPRVGSATDPG